MSPALAVVVPCCRPGRLATFLSGFEGAPPGQVQVIVVGDVDGVDEAWCPPGVTLELLDEPDPHTNRRRERGVAATTAPLLAFLDDDATPDPGWVDAALSVDVECDEVVTGPERPLRSSRGAKLAYVASASPLAAGALTHVRQRAGEVAWFAVPFCNCVVPRRLLEHPAAFPVDVPWDMDDFAVFFQLRSQVEFRNEPRLSIRHDRYPDEIGEWLREGWTLRRRTGEKCVLAPNFYLRVPGVVAALVGPWIVIASLLVSTRRGSAVTSRRIVFRWLALGVSAIAIESARVARASRDTRASEVFGVLGLRCATAVLAFHWGVFRRIAGFGDASPPGAGKRRPFPAGGAFNRSERSLPV